MKFGETITLVGQTLENQGRQFVDSAIGNLKQQAMNEAKNAARKAIDKGMSYVPGPLRGAANSILDGLLNGSPLGGILGGVSGCDGGAMYSDPEDFNELRLINKKLVSTEFLQEWNFRLEIEDQPEDFELYIKDLTHTGFELGTDEEKYGSASFTWPISQNPMRISFTARDNYDLRVLKFLFNWYRSALVGGGVVGLPLGEDGYVKQIKIYNVRGNGEETLVWKILAYPIQCGDFTRSHENAQFMEMPVTLAHFSTLYNSGY